MAYDVATQTHWAHQHDWKAPWHSFCGVALIHNSEDALVETLLMQCFLSHNVSNMLGKMVKFQQHSLFLIFRVPF